MVSKYKITEKLTKKKKKILNKLVVKFLAFENNHNNFLILSAKTAIIYFQYKEFFQKKFYPNFFKFLFCLNYQEKIIDPFT